MSVLTVNWMRFAKIFVLLFGLGCAAWFGIDLLHEDKPAAPAIFQPTPPSNTLALVKRAEDTHAALLICIGDLDNKEWTEVLSDPDNSDIEMVYLIDAATDSVVTQPIQVSGIRERVIKGVRSRADFARVMAIAGKLAEQLDPSAVLFVGSPSEFNPLKRNTEVPSIATDETMSQIVASSRSIGVYHARPARRDNVMQALVDELKSRSSTVKEVIFK